MTTLVGCSTVADVAGYNTAALNNSAAKNYSQVISKASGEGTIDRTSNTAIRVNRIFNRLKP